MGKWVNGYGYMIHVPVPVVLVGYNFYRSLYPWVQKLSHTRALIPNRVFTIRVSGTHWHHCRHQLQAAHSARGNQATGGPVCWTGVDRFGPRWYDRPASKELLPRLIKTAYSACQSNSDLSYLIFPSLGVSPAEKIILPATSSLLKNISLLAIVKPGKPNIKINYSRKEEINP